MAKQLRTDQANKDRISSLPDPILCHILSFLPTKYAVSTSVLSPRWRYLFTSLPSLDFDDSLVLNHNKSNRKLAITFSRFIQRVSTSCKVSNMDKFKLKVNKKIKISRIESAIRAALSRNVRELDLYIYMNKFFALPQAVFTSKTLVVLKLHDKVLLNNVPGSVCLPCVTILHLDFLEFQGSDSLNRLISGCPMLEDLLIDDCKWDYCHVFNISSATLKSLDIRCKSEGERFTPENEDHHEFHIHKLIVDAPSLKVLNIYGDIAEAYSLTNLHSLEGAGIDVMEHLDIYATPVKFEDIILGLVKGISEVKALRLCLYGIWSCKGFADSLPMFHNMTHLVLGGQNGLEWQALHNLLHNTPKLEVLTFVVGVHFEFTEEELPQSSSELVPSCLLFHLKTIEFGAFYGGRSELELVKYFLQNAKVLDKLLMLTVYITEEKELKAREEVLKFPKCSEMCQVLFYKYSL